MFNLVEALSDDVAFDQRCAYGCRVDGHAVYCHNNDWVDAPRKCRRSWYYGQDEAAKEHMRDEDCPGFKPNLEYEQAG